LRDYAVLKPNEVWSTDITYIPMRHGYMYLTAIIDWYSRYVISWELSNTLETDFCSRALKRALNKNKPLIFNTDQGSQFTSNDFTSILANHDISISMDGKGRSLDNIFIERLWRTLKYENIYRHSYETVQELMESLRIYFNYYNRKRIHQSLNTNMRYCSPIQMHVNTPLITQQLSHQNQSIIHHL
jgi:putative transposase